MRWVVCGAILLGLASCGAKFTPPEPTLDDGSTAVDDTTYLQLRPVWEGFSRPHDVLIGRETLVFVADTGNNRVAMLDLVGNSLGYSAPIDSPVAVAEDAKLRLLVATGKNFLLRIDLFAAAHRIESAAVDTLYKAVDHPTWRFNGVEAFYVPSEGGIYYLVTCGGDERNANQILFIREDGTVRGPLNLTPGGTGLFAVADPSGICAVRDRSVDFAYCQRGENYYKVQMVTVDAYGWKPLLDPSSGGDLFTLGKFERPQDVDIDGDGFLYIVDSDLCRVFKFSGFGKEYQSFGERGVGEKQFMDPCGIAEFDGTVFVADTGNDRIVRFRLSTDTR
ncbi:hypothetical protein JXA88_02150 [Candidatus Fermentibacteria bacterium]|nr:hypothetical protein [Candidatus Fermentibacteria bacterium]